MTATAASERRTCDQIDAIVLDQLGRANGPIGAYDIAARASASGNGLVANQVYRTLNRLIEKGRVHRIESLAAYILRRGEGDFCLICAECHTVKLLNTPGVSTLLSQLAGSCSFHVRRMVVETHGRCAACIKGDAVRN